MENISSLNETRESSKSRISGLVSELIAELKQREHAMHKDIDECCNRRLQHCRDIMNGCEKKLSNRQRGLPEDVSTDFALMPKALTNIQFDIDTSKLSALQQTIQRFPSVSVKATNAFYTKAKNNLVTVELKATLKGHKDGISDMLVLDEKQGTLASSSWDGSIKVWDKQSNATKCTLRGHSDSVSSICSAPSGHNELISGGWDKLVKVWNRSTGTCELTMSGHTGKVVRVQTFGGEEKTYSVVSCGDDRVIKVWERATGRCVATLAGHTNLVSSLAIWNKANGQDTHIVSGSWDESIKVWSVKDNECRMTLCGHTNTVSALLVAPSSDELISECTTKMHIFKNEFRFFNCYTLN